MSHYVDGFVLPLRKDKVNARVMAAPRINEFCTSEGAEMPFDCQRMAYGGFKTLVEA